MRMNRARSVWLTTVIAATAVVAVACGGGAEATAVPTSATDPAASPAAETGSGGSPTAVATDDATGTAGLEYADAVRAISERFEARAEELLEPEQPPAPGPSGFLTLLAEAIPQLIEGAQSDIADLDALSVPEEYLADHRRAIVFFRDQISLARRELEAVEARDDLTLRQLSVEREMLERNVMGDLSPSFREFFLVSEEAVEMGELFGDLTEEDRAYLDTLTMGFEEFRKRAAVFGQVLSRQFADANALLEALRGAGAGTAFEAVQTVVAPVDPPPRFAADHQLLLAYLEGVVRLDREVGKAVEEGDPVHFVVSNFGLATVETTVEAGLGLSPQVLNVVFPFPASAFREPSPEVLDGGYREGLHTVLREFRARFLGEGPDYAGFNLVPADVYQVVSRTGPSFAAVVEGALEEVSALVPPEGLRDDHDLVVRYFEETFAAQRAIIDAAAAEDFAGVQDGINRTHAIFCETANGVSATMRPVVLSQFGEAQGCEPPG